MKANEILKVLGQFQESSYQKILIDGVWGIGKTKYISNFIGNYSNTCYVSLFGKKDVNTMLQEIYFQILDQLPSGKMKKYFSILRQKMNSLDVSYFGVSLSIPVLQNMLSTLNKELSQKDTFIIVFDDLERKHNDLNIKEVFGVVDSLSKIDKIKVVLVAATNHIKDDEEKADYTNFREKAIDRIYTIEEYADEAPREILRDEVWRVIGNLAADLKFKNLRTFEKTNHFIREVTQTLGDDLFSEKFTRDDLYRMCFASVVFKIEHNGEMVLLDHDAPNSELINIFYTTEGSGVIEYLCNFILKNSLDNDMCKSIFPHIKKWFETGTYSEEVFTSLISNINNYKEEPHNFFSSESQIEAMINHTRKYSKNLQGDEKIGEIITNLTSAYSWCEILSVDFGINDEEVLDLISSREKLILQKRV
ncbi:hypothetical protein JNUCC31_03670 [Paenibacillus sp. JNUCC31]|uniref:P-loop NTPase fold protein n=1 Tax=Paenibacillus sp. JNUCC-31 TaxID=2777983 RepID=UPI0017825B99|nr:P-loop NTPase fold protein [Paenibacillus sp. JNUCC-31]QOS80057.1 hypothetical protein JNUCC31_03670 [Paenibacillus sp. JNUCC-31]